MATVCEAGNVLSSFLKGCSIKICDLVGEVHFCSRNDFIKEKYG